MNQRLLFLLFFISCSFFSFSQDWIYIGKDSEGNKYSMRYNNATDLLGNKKIWVKQESKNLKYIKKGKSYSILNGYSMNLIAFDCSARQIQLIRTVYYTSKGSEVYEPDLSLYQREWKDVTPERIDEFILDKACTLF